MYNECSCGDRKVQGDRKVRGDSSGCRTPPLRCGARTWAPGSLLGLGRRLAWQAGEGCFPSPFCQKPGQRRQFQVRSEQKTAEQRLVRMSKVKLLCKAGLWHEEASSSWGVRGARPRAGVCHLRGVWASGDLRPFLGLFRPSLKSGRACLFGSQLSFPELKVLQKEF